MPSVAMWQSVVVLFKEKDVQECKKTWRKFNPWIVEVDISYPSYFDGVEFLAKEQIENLPSPLPKKVI